jgi:hypothetical protein
MLLQCEASYTRKMLSLLLPLPLPLPLRGGRGARTMEILSADFLAESRLAFVQVTAV